MVVIGGSRCFSVVLGGFRWLSEFQFKSTKNKILPEQTWLVIETNAFEAQALQTSYLDSFKDASSDKIQFKTHNFSH